MLQPRNELACLLKEDVHSVLHVVVRRHQRQGRCLEREPHGHERLDAAFARHLQEKPQQRHTIRPSSFSSVDGGWNMVEGGWNMVDGWW